MVVQFHVNLQHNFSYF